MLLMLDPAFLLQGTPLQYLMWILVLIAVVLLWVTVEKGNGFTLLIHLGVIALLAWLAMSVTPAHGETPRKRAVVEYPVPEPRPRPAIGHNEICDNQCLAIGKQPGCKEKRLCYEGIAR